MIFTDYMNFKLLQKKWLVPGFHAEIHVVHESWMSLPLTFQRDALRLPPYSYPFVWWLFLQPYMVGSCESQSARFLPGFQEVQVTIVHWAPRNAATLSVQICNYMHYWYYTYCGLWSPTRNVRRNPLCRSQELQVTIVHWPCRHVYRNSSSTRRRNSGCVYAVVIHNA